MYRNITLKGHTTEEKKHRNKWFTLVEIMIVIVIMVLLTQLGNLGGLFRSRERNQVEEIAVKILATIDEEKINALLWKTLDGKIVRKRHVNITINNENSSIEVTSKLNLAEAGESLYDEKSRKTESWSLAGLKTFMYRCDQRGPATPIDTGDISIEFRDDTITVFNESTSIPKSIILLLTNTNTSHELHIDRRTGLTYEIKWKDKAQNSTQEILCN